MYIDIDIFIDIFTRLLTQSRPHGPAEGATQIRLQVNGVLYIDL